MTDKRFWKKKK